jgi:hypothetical protein
VGEDTSVDEVQPFVSAVTKRVALHGLPNVYKDVSRILALNQSALDANKVLLIFQGIGDNGKPTVESKAFGLHTDTHAFGYAFQDCGNPHCPGITTPLQLRPDCKPGTVRLRCIACHWLSGWVTLKDNEHFTAPQGQLAPRMYSHNFPATSALRGIFIDAVKEAGKGRRKKPKLA